MGWQPIEVAPKDGTPVDLWSAKGFRVASCAWDVTEYGGMNEADVFGWTDTDGHRSVMGAAPFTHWMPLPEPPAN